MRGAVQRLRVIVTGILALCLVVVPALGASLLPERADAAASLRQVAHVDNPLRQGDSHFFMNSDLAFSGDFVVVGNYDGFSVWNITRPEKPTLVSVVECAGGQGDVSVVGNLVVLSIDDTMSSDRCDAERVPETQTNWEGLRIFDISDPAQPVYVTSVQTRCGSHTNTIVPSSDSNVVYVYVDAYSRGPSLHCTGVNPLQIVRLQLDDPQSAQEVASVDLFAGREPLTSADWVPGGAQTRTTTGCHDITVFGNRAVAACRGDGLYLDISDPLNPVVLDQVRDPEMSFWHSAIFSNDGSLVVFQDEMGDGMINACTEDVGGTRGADSVWRINGDKLEHVGYFKIPRYQSDPERCTAHNGSLIPVPGKNLIVQAWYDAGVSVVDFTDPSAATEIASFDPEPVNPPHEYLSGYWSAYYYNGFVYASNTWDGLDVFALDGAEFADAQRYVSTSLNPQTQPTYNWVWNQAPVLPDDKSTLPTLSVTPSEARALSGEDLARDPTFRVTVSAKDGTFVPNARVDIWTATSTASLAHGVANAHGGLDELPVSVRGTTTAGIIELIARDDVSRDALAWARIPIVGDQSANILAYSGWRIRLLVLVFGGLALVWLWRERRGPWRSTW